EHQLASLDLSAFQDVEQELHRVTERHADWVVRQSELQNELGGLHVQLNQINQRIRALSDQGDTLQDQRDGAEQFLLNAAARVSGLDPQQRLTQIDDMLARASDDFDLDRKSTRLHSSHVKISYAV